MQTFLTLEALNRVAVDGVGGIFPFLLLFSFFFAFVFFFAFLCFSSLSSLFFVCFFSLFS